jgi:hypothetical protein
MFDHRTLMPRVTAADRHEPSFAFRCFGLSDELSPCGASGVDDGVAIFEDGVREPVLTQILPDVLDQVQLRSARGEKDRRDVVGQVELARRVPSGSVEDESGVGALGDVARDFVEVELHQVGVGMGQSKGRPDASRRADRAEQIGVVVALIGGLPWPRSTPSPLPNLAVFLAHADSHSELIEGRPRTISRPASSPADLRDEPSARAGSFFEGLDEPPILSRMARAALMWEKPSLCKSFRHSADESRRRTARR